MTRWTGTVSNRLLSEGSYLGNYLSKFVCASKWLIVSVVRITFCAWIMTHLAGDRVFEGSVSLVIYMSWQFTQWSRFSSIKLGSTHQRFHVKFWQFITNISSLFDASKRLIIVMAHIFKNQYFLFSLSYYYRS